MNQTVEQKQRLRRQARRIRQQIHRYADQQQVARQLISHFLSLNLLTEETVIAGYWPCGSEVSVLPLMQEIYSRGYPIALPIVKESCNHLVFRQWQPELPLCQDYMGIPCPEDSQPILMPTVLLVPLLAFDVTGARLGQGMGFYDKIIRQLRTVQPITPIGVAYDAQKIDYVPVSAMDENMDYIITEKEVYRLVS